MNSYFSIGQLPPEWFVHAGYMIKPKLEREGFYMICSPDRKLEYPVKFGSLVVKNDNGTVSIFDPRITL